MIIPYSAVKSKCIISLLASYAVIIPSMNKSISCLQLPTNYIIYMQFPTISFLVLYSLKLSFAADFMLFTVELTGSVSS